MKQRPQLIAQTDRWIVLDKPPGWIVVPGRSTAAPVIIEWVRAEIGSAWVVHRIDRDTSGVLLLARTAEAHREANGWFEKGLVKKTYDCLVAGRFSLPMLRIDRPIGDQACLTQIESQGAWQEGSLLRARPRSGRRHQIRIHLQHEGHPLWGDSEYGGPEKVTLGSEASGIDIPRVALHASRLELPGGEVFEAPWPEDFRAWVDALRERGTRA